MFKISLYPRGVIAAAVLAAAFALPTKAATIYSENFESGATGFTLNGFWHDTANAPYSGNFALGYVHDETAGASPNGSYAGTGGQWVSAFSPLITLPNTGSLNLSFAARVDDEIGDAPDAYDSLSIDVFNTDTLTDTVVASSKPTQGGIDIPENVGFNLFNVDLSAFAGQNVELEFRFATFDGIDDAHPGPRIDDIAITTDVAVPEVQTWATLAGVSLIGLHALRRRNLARA